MADVGLRDFSGAIRDIQSKKIKIPKGVLPAETEKALEADLEQGLVKGTKSAQGFELEQVPSTMSNLLDMQIQKIKNETSKVKPDLESARARGKEQARQKFQQKVTDQRQAVAAARRGPSSEFKPVRSSAQGSPLTLLVRSLLGGPRRA